MAPKRCHHAIYHNAHTHFLLPLLIIRIIAIFLLTSLWQTILLQSISDYFRNGNRLRTPGTPLGPLCRTRGPGHIPCTHTNEYVIINYIFSISAVAFELILTNSTVDKKDSGVAVGALKGGVWKAEQKTQPIKNEHNFDHILSHKYNSLKNEKVQNLKFAAHNVKTME